MRALVRFVATLLVVAVAISIPRAARANPGPPAGYFHTCDLALQCPRGVQCLRHWDDADCEEKALAAGLVERCRHYDRRVFCPRDAPFEGASGLHRSPYVCSVEAQCSWYGLEWKDDEPPVPYEALDDYAGFDHRQPWVLRCSSWPNGRKRVVICPRSTFDMALERHPDAIPAAVASLFVVMAGAALLARRRRKALHTIAPRGRY